MTNTDLQTLTDLMEKYGPNGFLQGCVTAFEERAEEVYSGNPTLQGHGARNCYLNAADRLRDVADFAENKSYAA